MAAHQLASRSLRPVFVQSSLKTFALTRMRHTFSTSAVSMGAVSDAIQHDHRELEEYCDNILNATDVERRIGWQNKFTWELARHSIAEELVIYPAMEKHVPNGTAMAEKDRKEHYAIKEALYKFQDLDPKDSDFEPTLKDLMSQLRQHIKGEEKDDLPVLEDALPASEAESLAGSFGRTKMFVPTRSHPDAPDKPPFETVAGLMAAPIDRLRDMFAKFPRET